MLSACDIPGLHQSQSRRDRCGTVSCIKDIAITFFSLWKTAESMKLAQRFETVLSSGKNFVSVGLMPHVPDDLVFGQGQCQMQRHGQFHRSQIGAQMPACDTDGPDQEFTNLLRKDTQIFFSYLLNIICLFYGFQQHTQPYPFRCV